MVNCNNIHTFLKTKNDTKNALLLLCIIQRFANASEIVKISFSKKFSVKKKNCFAFPQMKKEAVDAPREVLLVLQELDLEDSLQARGNSHC